MKKLIIFLLFAFYLLPTQAFAQSSADKRTGVTISPSFQEVVVTPKDQRKVFAISVLNNQTKPATFRLSAIDMGALDETGGVAFSGLPASYKDNYQLAEWLSYPQEQFTVQPKKVYRVEVTVRNDTSLTPGGHYGAVVVQQVIDEKTEGKVNFNPEITSLVFLKKLGGEKYELDLDAVIFKAFKTATLKFKNAGNVHVVPRGTVTIKDPLGRVIRTSIINEPSQLVLPELERTLISPLIAEKRAFWPGRYTAKILYRYDGVEDYTLVKKSFFSITLPSVIIVILLALLIILERRFQLVKRYHVRRLPKVFLKEFVKTVKYFWKLLLKKVKKIIRKK